MPVRINIIHSWRIEHSDLAGDMLNIVTVGKSGDRSWQTVDVNVNAGQDCNIHFNAASSLFGAGY